MAKFPARLPRSRLEKPRSREPSQPALSYEHIENFTKDLEVKRDLGNRASPVNRAHMKRPSDSIVGTLSSAEASLYCGEAFVWWGGWGERKRERPGHDGRFLLFRLLLF